MIETDPSQPLKSSMQELFCQKYTQGMTATEAYRQAGYSHKGADGHAIRLVGIGRIRARIEHIRAKQAKKLEITREGQAKKYQEAYDLASDLKSPTGMVQATAGQDRLFGLEKQVIEQSEAQRRLSETQASEASKLADIRLREDMAAKAEKVPQNGTGEHYAVDWTDDSQDKDNTESTGSNRSKQGGQEQDDQKAIER